MPTLKYLPKELQKIESLPTGFTGVKTETISYIYCAIIAFIAL